MRLLFVVLSVTLLFGCATYSHVPTKPIAKDLAEKWRGAGTPRGRNYPIYRPEADNPYVFRPPYYRYPPVYYPRYDSNADNPYWFYGHPYGYDHLPPRDGFSRPLFNRPIN